jgi:hypothetical protein
MRLCFIRLEDRVISASRVSPEWGAATARSGGCSFRDRSSAAPEAVLAAQPRENVAAGNARSRQWRDAHPDPAKRCKATKCSGSFLDALEPAAHHVELRTTGRAEHLLLETVSTESALHT